MTRGPLEGVKILDFLWMAAGPLGTTYLADFGADVIKVESALSPDMVRVTPPYKDGKAGLDRAYNTALSMGSKRSIAINLGMEEGRHLARKLAACVDVVTDNYGADVMAKWGLGYESLRKLNPGIIVLTSHITGRPGPYANISGMGYMGTALAGFHHATGWPDRDPALFHQAYTDFVTPWFTALAILTALDYRRRTGKGQSIELTHFESGVYMLQHAMLNLVANGQDLACCGNRDARAVPHGVYPCQEDDSWCSIAVFTEQQWHSLCQVLGRPELATDPKYLDVQRRREHEEELDSLIAGWTRVHSADEAMHLMQEEHVPAGAVQSDRDMIERDPQLGHRNMFFKLDHPVVGQALHCGWPAKLSRTPSQPQRAPLLGEHTVQILTETLHLSDSELAELISAGVLE